MTSGFVYPDTTLIAKYSGKGPYYTSYPTGGVWNENFGNESYCEALASIVGISSQGGSVPSSLYVHFPFCARLCRFCFCYTCVSRNWEAMDSYLLDLKNEIELLARFFDTYVTRPSIREIHLGGGSPSYLDPERFRSLVKSLDVLTEISNLREFTIEIDISTLTREKLEIYAECGISRISFGIQDFTAATQEAIGRIQPPEKVAQFLEPNLRKRFKSVNFDLMYGLPHQTRSSFNHTMDAVLELSPDRAALYNYCHMPDIYTHQASINKEHLPDPVQKELIFLDTCRRFEEAGYVHVGIDHFAKPGEELAQAVAKGTLNRHFMGYCAGHAPNLFGIGASSLHGFTDYYAQNVYSLDEYHSLLQSGLFPIHRGYCLNHDDHIRREAINEILCFFQLDLGGLAGKYGLDMQQYFQVELEMLRHFEDEGIVSRAGDSFAITPGSKLFARHVCMVFDIYAPRTEASGQAYKPAVQRSGTSINLIRKAP